MEIQTIGNDEVKIEPLPIEVIEPIEPPVIDCSAVFSALGVPPHLLGVK